MAQDKINKTCAFIIGSVVFIAVTGLLIYLCLYLTRYTPPSNTTVMTSATNNSRIALFNSTKLLKIVTNPINDNEDDDIISQPDATIPVLKKALISSLKRVEVPSVINTEEPTLTRVIVPSKASKQVTYIPETITLHDVKQ